MPYVNGWINETTKALALEGGMDKIGKLIADLKKQACCDLNEAAAGTAPVPEVGQVMDVTLAKAAEQNYAYKGRKQYQPPGKPTKDSKTVEGPGAFEGMDRPDGYYVVTDKGGSVAWFATEPEAKKEADRLNQRGGRNYSVEAGKKPLTMRESISQLSKVLEHWGKSDSAVAEQEGAETEVEPEAEPEAKPEVPSADKEPGDEGEALTTAVKMNLSQGVAQGVISALASVFGDPIDFSKPDVVKAIDEIERQYTQKGRQFFTQLRAEVQDMGAAPSDEVTRAAVRVFRELA